MKGLWILLLLGTGLAEVIHRIALINQHTQEAATAYAQKNFYQAIASYEYLQDSLQAKEDRISLNLAQAYRSVGATEKSLALFETLTQHPDRVIASLALLQQGLLLTQQQAFAQGLDAFKQALVRDPRNQVARYNFEALKKYLALHPEKLAESDSLPATAPPPPQAGGQGRSEPSGEPGGDRPGTGGPGGGTPPTGTAIPENQPQGQNQEAGSDAGKETQASGQEPGETQGTTPSGGNAPPGAPARGGQEALTEKDQRAQTLHQNLEEINLSQEKAQMLLEALKQAEMQHIQQLPYKGSKKPNSRKPDW